jgi:OFA family oxalate/formate antiporter-like MFS transporter
MGIGLGTGYLTPVKTLMMWFYEHKGLATGIAITGFGLAKVIASPIIQALLEVTSIENLFYILGASYCVLMSIGAALIKKPEGMMAEMKGESFNLKESLKFILNPKYLAIWFVFYLNITCGLALISQEKPIVSEVGLLGMVALIASLTAALNALGRFGYATISDTLRDRGVVYFAIFLSSAIFTLLGGIGMIANLSTPVLIIGMLLVCNAGYGGGFSTLPALLNDKFGMKNVSVIHGFALSAWAWAGLSGNQLGNWMITTYGYPELLWILTGLYSVAMVVTWIWIMDRSPKR